MDTESINSLLKYFPYTEAEKSQVRELLMKRDPALMAALNNFLQTKDVTALNREFKIILAQQAGGAASFKTTTYVSSQAPGKEVIYTSPNISRGYESNTTYTVGGVPGGYTSTTYGGVSGGLASGGYTTGGLPSGGYMTYGASNTGYGVPTQLQQPVSKPQPPLVSYVSPTKTTVTYQEDLKEVDGGSKSNLTESVKRSKEIQDNIQRLKRMSDAGALKKSIGGQENLLKGFTFDFLPEQIKNNYLEPECKQKLIEMAKSLSFENFLDIRHFLRLDKIELISFIDKAQNRVWELHPCKPGQDATTYNPGFSLEEFINLLCGDSEIPKNQMGYIGLLFYYMDYNHNQILEIDEILQGFIMLGPGDKKDKITAAFHALGGGSMCLTETQLAHYLEIVIRVYKLREDAGPGGDQADLYDIQQSIDLAAKSLARKIYEVVDFDQSGVLSLEEFLIWFDKIEARANMFELSKDIAFKNSLDLAKESKKKRLDTLRYSTDLGTQIETKEKFKNDILDNGLHTKQLESLKRTLKVDQCYVQTAVKIFHSMNYAKALTVKEFNDFFKKLYQEEDIKLTPEEMSHIDKEIVRFFQILDTNKNGVLEWDELMSALIFVLQGSESEKARIAFEMFDTNKDATLQFKELFFFLKGIFNLLMYDNPHELFKKESPDAIAFATAKECFAQFKLDLEKDAIDYQTFQKWYSSNI